MKTSGVDEPPEISVASVARLVSVFVGADTSVTWMFGYTLLKAVISVVRVSPCELVVMGLADHTIEPDVAEPAAADVPLDGELVLVLVLVLADAGAAATAAAGHAERPDDAHQGGQLPALRPPRRILHRSLSCH